MEGSIETPGEGPSLRNIQRRVIWMSIIIITILMLLATGGQILSFYLNVQEFGELYVKPIYYGIIGGFILSIIMLTRLDFRNRKSISWWSLMVLVRVAKGRGDIENITIDIPEFRTFRLTPLNFALWQVTKIIIGSTLLLNTNLGMAITGLSRGWESGLSKIPSIFALPFITPPFEMSYAQQNVIPMVPALTLIVLPILGVIGIRLVLLVGVTEILNSFSSIIINMGEDAKEIRIPLVTIESLVALGLFWTGFNLFFPSYIDYNSKFIIGGVFAAGFVFAIFAYLDRPGKSRVLRLNMKPTSLRIGAILIIGLLVGSAISVQGSIADAKKVEWNGPYTTQEISVNRYLAQLDDVQEVPYDFSLTPVASQNIDGYVNEHRDILDQVRLWDLAAAEAKLRPEIGLIPYIDFQDTDILRFNGSLYWSASMKPILPSTVEASNRWFAEHLVYTHVPNGFLLLDGNEGRIVETSDFFDQRRIYYGEGGLFDDVWSAYPQDRQTSDELGGFLYNGNGGINIPPPLSWLFEPNFLLARASETIHVMRYKDVYDRMNLLFPYFIYNVDGKPVDMYPVTDGESTYWLMPLIVAVDTTGVPWSDRNPFVRHVGYALIDTFNGDITLHILGNDFYSNLFKNLYSDYVSTSIPNWLVNQTRYPEEFFEYRVNLYNFYHITDAATFIEAREFFEIPPQLDTYFIMAKPPGFSSNEFLGLLSLQLRGSPGQNLAGYMVIENDYPNLGQMTFYEVPLDAATKLLGPTAIIEALERNPDFATLRTLLRNPRVGDNILYRIGEHDVYFIPVYTAREGGVVTQLGTVAAIGAAFDGEYYVGFGDTPKEAFEQYLLELSGVSVKQLPDLEPKPGPGPAIIGQGINKQILNIFSDNGISVVTPDGIPSLFKFKEFQLEDNTDPETVQSVVNDFISTWMKSFDVTRIYYWTDETSVNYGAVINVNGVSELHYITIIK